jgi:hypothetical protein
MKDTFIAVLAILTIFVVLPILILWLRDRVTNRLPTPEEIEEHGRRFRERLLNPDFPALEAHFGHPLPQALKNLHADRDELLRFDFEVFPPGRPAGSPPWAVCYYQPMDAEQLKAVWPGREKFLEIADDGTGNAYMVDPTRADPPVLFHDHETGEVEEVSGSLSEFLKWPRRAAEE